MSDSLINMNGFTFAIEEISKKRREEALIEMEIQEKHPDLLIEYLKTPYAEKILIGKEITKITGWTWYGDKLKTVKKLFSALGNNGNYHKEYTLLFQAWKNLRPEKF